MNKKRYRLIQTVLILIGFVFVYYIPSTFPYVVFVVITITVILDWKNIRVKWQQATTEDEIRPIVVPFILAGIILVFAMVSLIL
ncbi:hypothetical protein MUN88_20595 [Gracilibacillus caseinilyticus]|uniref:Phosphatidate cytidylyltransferase n=1 Tax=Gracilibacillus caseinilyticus TaxID=2932256 RepID=A0ABY4F1V6_9BACI|nr:hypothetical protein [Gracilibacillus caseinilyticus]UOQ48401.1 hypothetical protein MUN88_20595 [Gracilibacillus caseinilyticus]